MRTLKWNDRGDDVAQLQQALVDRGYNPGPVDGIFGARTLTAVRRFQRDQGLSIDGIVGPRTWRALGVTVETPTGPTTPTTPTGGGGTGANKAVSLHIGLNAVDPNGYGGWSGPLTGCEADAATMRAIAQAEGFTVNTLLTAQATSGQVLSYLAAVARDLDPGDMFMLTYAGHGGQMPNNSPDPEDDGFDETWCLYDRQLLDDELNAALATFTRGVNIVMLSDSCHSGTMHRMDLSEPLPSIVARGRRYALAQEEYYRDKTLPAESRGDDILDQIPRLRPRGNGQLSDRELELVGAGGPAAQGLQLDPRRSKRAGPNESGADDQQLVKTRDMPFDTMTRLWMEQGGLYDDIRNGVRDAPFQANGVYISGCQDSQLSQETGGNGVFTTVLKRVWANNTFSESYTKFHKLIVSQMLPDQTPNLVPFGPDPHALLDRTPFNR